MMLGYLGTRSKIKIVIMAAYLLRNDLLPFRRSPAPRHATLTSAWPSLVRQPTPSHNWHNEETLRYAP